MFGLYIGDTNIFTATARRRPGGLDIANAKITALPEGLIINGYIQDESAAASCFPASWPAIPAPSAAISGCRSTAPR